MTRSARKSFAVLTVDGTVDGTSTGELRARLLEALDVAAGTGTPGDVALDVRGVVAFDDAALPALTAARTRAKYLRHRLVVVDAAGGAVATALRRSGLHYRFPMYADVAAAESGLAVGRTASRRRLLGRVPPPDAG